MQLKQINVIFLDVFTVVQKIICNKRIIGNSSLSPTVDFFSKRTIILLIKFIRLMD